MQSSRPLPIAALLLGLVASALLTMAIIVILFALAGFASDGRFSGEMVLRGWINGIGFALPAALLIGFPLAAWRLRDPDLPRKAWTRTGAIAGAIAGIAIDLVLALLTPALAMFGPAWPGLMIGVFGITVSASVVAAQLARRFTFWFAARLPGA